VLSGRAHQERKLAICSGAVPLSPEDHAELLAVLVADADPLIAERAQNAVLMLPLEAYLASIKRSDADPRVFAYCADYLGDKPGIPDALAKNPACPTVCVARVAPGLTAEGIQALLDNLERFTDDPLLVAAVAKCTGASETQKEMLGELEKGAISMIELHEAAAEIEPDPIKRQTLMQRVTHMNVVQRLTLALKGGRTERMLLIRDPNKLVQRAVLQSPRLTDSEVEAFSAMTNLTGEILRQISSTRIFMKNYAIVKNLVYNPKTPLDVSLHLFPRLTAPDLLKLTANKNIPDTLRTTAQKLHRKRKAGG
jgi:hypothetical protein